MDIANLEERLQAELENLDKSGHFKPLRALIAEYAAENTKRRFALKFHTDSIEDGSKRRISALAVIGTMRAMSNPDSYRVSFGLMPKENHGTPCAQCEGFGYKLEAQAAG